MANTRVQVWFSDGGFGRRVLFAVAGLCIAGSVAGCGSKAPISQEASSASSTTVPPTTAIATTTAEPATTTTTSAAPGPTAEVVFTYINPEPFLRFVAEIKNPATQTRTGVRITWKALDANGVIVLTYHNDVAPIPAGGLTYYVGGAGSARLTGTPVSAKVEVTDPGTLTAAPPVASATVESPTFKRSRFDRDDGTRNYEASFVLAASKDVKVDDLNTAILLKDAAGQIIGADWADTSAASSALKAGEKANATASVLVPTGEPATIEAYVYG